MRATPKRLPISLSLVAACVFSGGVLPSPGTKVARQKAISASSMYKCVRAFQSREFRVGFFGSFRVIRSGRNSVQRHVCVGGRKLPVNQYEMMLSFNRTMAGGRRVFGSLERRAGFDPEILEGGACVQSILRGGAFVEQPRTFGRARVRHAHSLTKLRSLSTGSMKFPVRIMSRCRFKSRPSQISTLSRNCDED